MSQNTLTVREMSVPDIALITQYWLGADHSFLKSMGVDVAKLPTQDGLTQMLLSQLNTSIEKRNAYCIIWQVNGQPVGHCNTNPTFFGKDAYMHLHLWNTNVRQKGLGTMLLKMTLPYFFEKLQLKKICSEPYALNPAPNKTLEKAGFTLVKEYITTPGSLNFEQPVKRWQLTYDEFLLIKEDR